MGMLFSNIHIKKNESFSKDDLLFMMKENLFSKGYKQLNDSEDADVELMIYYPQDSDWISVASDIYYFSNDHDTEAVARPISDKFNTYVIAAACIDSDYAFMHLIGNEGKIDGWINSGKPYDGMKIPRRTKTAPWNDVVSDFDKFKALTKEKYIFAEEMLTNLSEYLGMKPEQCLIEAGNTENIDEKQVSRLFFTLSDGIKNEPPKLKITRFDLTACVPNKNKVVFVNNKGGRSKGVAVMFTGDYIENGEVEIYDTTFESDFGSEKRKAVPIVFEKKKTQDGKTVLWWEDKNFQIPPAVNTSLPVTKQEQLEWEKEFGVRFFVRGNERKFLDIKVFIIPLKNYQNGADCWYVYKRFGTKRKYVENMIERTNEMLSHYPKDEVLKRIELNPHMYSLDPNKYDLD